MKKSLVALALAALMLFSAVAMSSCGEKALFDFSNTEEITKYLDASVQYSGLSVTYTQKTAPTMEEVEKALEAARVANKTPVTVTEENPAPAIDEYTDLALYYVAYDAEGHQLAAFTNLGGAFDFSKLQFVTSGTFSANGQTDEVLKLLGESLVGKMANEFTLTGKENGTALTAEDFVYVSYHATTETDTGETTDGKETTVGIDLSSPKAEDTDEGKVARLILKAIAGEIEAEAKIGSSFTAKMEETDKTSYTVSLVMALGGTPVLQQIRVPEEYKTEELRDTLINFELYLGGAAYYTLPALDAQFIKEKLEYETTLTGDEEVLEAYKADQLAALEKADKSAKIQALWNQIVNAAKMKAYNDDFIAGCKEELINNVGANYSYMKSLYAQLGITFPYANAEEYIRANFGAKNDEELDAAVTTKAKWQFREKCVFFYIKDVADYDMTEEYYTARLQKLLDEYNKSAKESAQEAGTEFTALTLSEYVAQCGGDKAVREVVEDSFAWDYVLEQLMEVNTFTVKDGE